MGPHTEEVATATVFDPGDVERQLRAAECALVDGDGALALRHVRHARRSLPRASPAAPPRLRLVGGVVLTAREIATLRQLPDATLSQKDMARALDVSRNTVKTHLRSLYRKLGVHCRGEAIHRARELGLLPSLWSAELM